MRPARRSGGVGYVLRKFPVLSETFILQEILALEADGIPVRIFSLGRPSIPRFHEDLARLKATVSYVPELFELRTLLRANIQAAKRYRQGYLRALGYVAARGNPTLFWRFLQSGYVADKAGQLRLPHLHAHFATRATSVVFLASMMSGVPFSFTAHAVDIYSKRVKPKILARKIEGARFVVTVSDFNKRYLAGLTRRGSDRIVRIYNGIDLARFVPDGTPPRSPFTIVAVARLVEKKGLDVLVEACRHLRDRGIDFRCWIVGTGRLRPRLDALIDEWHLRGHVQLLGALTPREVLDRYRSAHLFALPCRVDAEGNRDGLPVSIVEALACGIPVVTTPMTGIPEVVRHQHNGLFVDEGDARGFADAIERVAPETALYRHLQANARTSVADAFDRRQSAQALRALFEGGRA